jgi:NodT family efflux transporter outer membrane factor (OMF) lipoprotein
MCNLKTICLLLAAAALAGCAVGPNYHTPNVPMPSDYDTGQKLSVTGSATTQLVPDEWWTSFSDSELNSLVSRATTANLDLGIAIARLGEARSQRYVVAANWWPGVNASGAYGKSTGNNATRGRVDSPLNAASDTSNKVVSISHLGGFDATWEIDLFGRVTRAVQAADADAQAFAEARNQVLVVLVADVVRNYSHLRATQHRLEIARADVDLQQRSQDLVRRRLAIGLSTQTDLALVERELESARATMAPLVAEIAVTERQLAVLLGGDPQSLYAELDRPQVLVMPATVSLGEPGNLLRRRPDIRQAERQLASATYLVGVATADLFPRFSVSGGFGRQSEGSWSSPFDARSIYSWGPSAQWPLLDFGRLEAALQVQDWRTQQVLLNYRKTIEVAVQEVDDAVGRFAAEQDHLQHLQAAVAASDRAAKLTAALYGRGLTDYLNVLDAQRELFILEDQAAISQEAVVTDWSAINKALGRGWETIAPGCEPTSKPPGISPPIQLVTSH